MSDLLQKQFEKFHDNIKLERFKENATLREKRNIILDKLKSGLDKVFEELEIEQPRWEWFNQGSYDMRTGIKPLDGDYDIDIGLKFHFDKNDFDPVEVKKWVKDALEGHTKKVKIKEPCVTVQYSVHDEPIYHVDLAIYAFEESVLLFDEYTLARGKEHSSEENRSWEKAAPIKLSDELKNRFSDEDDKQYRRIIRYLKRWKDLKFPSEGNGAPSGIGFTVAAYEWFSPVIGFFNGEPNDLKALKNFVGTILSHFTRTYNNEDGEYYYRLKVELPVKPYSDIFIKMTDKQMSEFKGKLENLRYALEKASVETDPHEAAKILAGQFGDDFPIPEKKDTAQSKKAAYSTSTSQA